MVCRHGNVQYRRQRFILTTQNILGLAFFTGESDVPLCGNVEKSEPIYIVGEENYNYHDAVDHKMHRMHADTQPKTLVYTVCTG